MSELRLYWSIARLAFGRRTAYRSANVAGLVTNTVFGYLRTAVFVALYQSTNVVGGYDLLEIVTYSWLIQSTLMVVQLWGWFEVEETIRTGDVVSDLYKPFSYLGYWLAQDFGRAAYYAVYRGLPIFLVGYLTMGMRLPESPITWVAFAASLSMAVVLSFCWRFALNLTAFWTTDARGIAYLGTAVVTLLGGFLVPLHFFPEPWRTIFLALPFASVVQTPVDVFMGRVTPMALARQVVWTVLALAACRWLVSSATRRVVVQGG